MVTGRNEERPGGGGRSLGGTRQIGGIGKAVEYSRLAVL
jgi:hypothetical protein